MAKPRRSPTAEPGNRIAYLRLEKGLSQEDMARLTGIPLRTYLRLERREVKNPGVRYLANIARVLGIDPVDGKLGDVVDLDMLEWQVFTEDGPTEQPDPEEHRGRFVHPAEYS